MMKFPVQTIKEFHQAICWVRISNWRGTYSYRTLLITGKSIGLYSIAMRIEEHWKKRLIQVLDEELAK